MGEVLNHLLEALRQERDTLISLLDSLNMSEDSTELFKTIGKLNKVCEFITALENILGVREV